MKENNMEAHVKYSYFYKKQSLQQGDVLFYLSHGQHMRFIGTKKVKSQSRYQSTTYRYEAKNCESYPLKSQCAKAKGNHVINVNHTLNGYKQETREKLISQERLDHRSKRPIEPKTVVDQMKYNMQYKRFSHFGIDKITMPFSFIVMLLISKRCLRCSQYSFSVLLLSILNLKNQ